MVFVDGVCMHAGSLMETGIGTDNRICTMHDWMAMGEINWRLSRVFTLTWRNPDTAVLDLCRVLDAISDVNKSVLRIHSSHTRNACEAWLQRHWKKPHKMQSEITTEFISLKNADCMQLLTVVWARKQIQWNESL